MKPFIRQLAVGIGATLLFSAAGSLSASEQPAARIVGGFEIDISDAPSTVALLRRFRVEQDGDLFEAKFCGGTIIDSRWVLTAAHCVQNSFNGPEQANSILVLTNSNDLDNPVEQPIGVTQIIVHEDYVNTAEGKDIALLKLESDTSAPTIPLDAQTVQIEDPAFIAGWGSLNSGDDGSPQLFPSILRGAFVELLPGDLCGSQNPDYEEFTDDTNICAGLSDGGVDTCQGDSGGPLYRVTEVGATPSSISGITSWGIGCGDANYPGVYTNVSSYIDWILENTGSETIRINMDPPAFMSEITVNGNTISWPDDGWYQVQNGDTFETICNGESSCTVAPGTYVVINHSSGQRFENIVVEDNQDAVTVNGQTISWQIDGWYEVQNAETFESVCAGEPFCTVLPGTYIVINHSIGQRFENIVVEVDSDAVTISGQTIRWDNDGWHQVLDAETFESICDGGSSCTVLPGTYVLINHSSGQRFENLIVEVDPDAVTVDGQTIRFYGEGWYQVLDGDTYEPLCNGLAACIVAPGTYIVINHSTGQRFENVVVTGD